MMVDWQKASVELAKPLDVAAIKPPPKGKYGEYVDGLHVISEANRIFGRNGWSYTVTRLECASNEVFQMTGNNGPYAQARVAYVCCVRVDVGGVIREGVACGTGNGKPENIGDVIESAVKEAETDALKRALRTFGNTFGLALYEKDKEKRETTANVYDPAPHIQRIEAAMTGRELLAAIKAPGCDNEHDAIRMARLARVEHLMNGAPDLVVLAKLQEVFAPDMTPTIMQAAAYRKEELERDA